jgi:hypothetical protein
MHTRVCLYCHHAHNSLSVLPPCTQQSVCIATMHTTVCQYCHHAHNSLSVFPNLSHINSFHNVPTILSMFLTRMVWRDVITIDPWAFTQAQQSFYMCKQQFTANMILCATVKSCDIPEYKLHLSRTFFFKIDIHSKIIHASLVYAYSPRPFIPSTQTTPRDDYWNSCIYHNHNILVARSPNWTYLLTCLLTHVFTFLLTYILTYFTYLFTLLT